MKKDRDVRDEGKGLRGGGVQGQERRDKERTDETTGAGEKEITAGSDRVVEINVARLIGATEECACGLSGSQLESYLSVLDILDDFRYLMCIFGISSVRLLFETASEFTGIKWMR